MTFSIQQPRFQPQFQGAPASSAADKSQPKEVLRVGLTGGIACGKSLIMQFLSQAGINTIDADDVVHQLLKQDQALKGEIRQAFGPGVFTAEGEIDRKKLGAIVFADPAKRRQLESMMHPKVRAEIEAFFRRHVNDKLAVAVIPLLFESNLEQFYDVVWLVKASQEQQIQRMIDNRGMTREEALARINSQMSYADKLKRLQALRHYAVIDNTGTPDETRRQVQKLVAEA